jgi:hypothetical protein
MDAEELLSENIYTCLCLSMFRSLVMTSPKVAYESSVITQRTVLGHALALQ